MVLVPPTLCTCWKMVTSFFPERHSWHKATIPASSQPPPLVRSPGALASLLGFRERYADWRQLHPKPEQTRDRPQSNIGSLSREWRAGIDLTLAGFRFVQVSRSVATSPDNGS